MNSPERHTSIIKKTAGWLAIPITMAIIGAAPIAVVIARSSPLEEVQFPDCKLDPRIKGSRIVMGNTLANTVSPGLHDPVKLKVDEITFRTSVDKTVAISANQNRINVIRPNEAYAFKGLTDGRTYTVVFDKYFSSGVKHVDIVGNCDTALQTNS